MADWSTPVPVVTLLAVLTQPAGSMMSTAKTHSATSSSRQQEQLRVEPTSPRMRVTFARCTRNKQFDNLYFTSTLNCRLRYGRDVSRYSVSTLGKIRGATIILKLGVQFLTWSRVLLPYHDIP